MTKPIERRRKMKKQDCNGCEQNFYNGNNPYNIQECWDFPRAKIVSRIQIGHWENPPYKNKMIIEKPNCYQQKGEHYINPDSITPEGYQK